MASLTFWIFTVTSAYALSFVIFCLRASVSRNLAFKYVCSGLLLGLIILLPVRFKYYDLYPTQLALYPLAVLFVAVTCVFVTDIKGESHVRNIVSEGQILLFSFSLMYAFSALNLFDQILMGVCAPMIAYVVYLCFANVDLLPQRRRWLAIWMAVSSAIMILRQAVPNYRAILPIHVEYLGVGEVLSYFLSQVLLGSSAIFLFWNILSLGRLGKGKRETNAVYHERLRSQVLPSFEASVLTAHVPLRAAIFLTVFHGVPLLLNWKFGVVPTFWMLLYATSLSPLLAFRIADRAFR